MPTINIPLQVPCSSQSNWVLVALDTILPQLAGSGIANADRSSFCLLLHKCTWPFSSR
uniref:Uncharacterized protein n=1 Tax=Anguilla anguilla TaxID=7936 RepID=A0A0E9SU15_ANGAN